MNQHIPSSKLAGSCFGQHTLERPIPLGCHPRWDMLDAPCRVDSMSAVGRDSSRDIWGTLPLIPEGFQSRLHFGLHPKVCDHLLMLRGQCWLQCN